MASSNIKIFDENKGNLMADEAYAIDTQRVNGVQSGIASSQLQNKTLFQVSLMAYALAQVMNQNGIDANDYDSVSTFVNNLSSSLLQKVNDKASTAQAQAGTDNTKWMTPALVKAWWDNMYTSFTLPMSKLSGTLPVAKGGTNITSNPSMLINLASTSAASVFAASPRPGVTGVLPGTNGGTGSSTCLTNAGANAILKKASDGNNMWYLNTANGAMYATAANGAPKFGILPIAQGGTGQTTIGNFIGQLHNNGVAVFQTGSYTGTGTGGSSSKNTITLGFVPKIVVVANAALSNGSYWSLFLMNPLTHKVDPGGFFQNAYSDIVVEWTSTGVSWYSTATMNPKYSQLNDTVLYHWFAIG